MEIARDVCRKLYESYAEHGDPMPEKLAEAYEGEFDTVIAVAV